MNYVKDRSQRNERVNELAVRLRGGDTSGLAELVRLTRGVRRSAHRAAGHALEDDHDDVPAIWDAAHRYDRREVGTFAGLLWLCIRDTDRNEDAAAKRRARIGAAWHWCVSDDYSHDPEWLMIRQEESAIARQSLGALLSQHDAETTALIKHVLLDDDMSVAEAAEVLGLRVDEARAKLQVGLGLIARRCSRDGA